MKITENFTYAEMVRTDTGLKNEPNPDHVIHLTRLCVRVLEPIRALLGAPLIVHSGYRCHEVNRDVGGSRNSAHLQGRACDFHPQNEILISEQFEKILNSDIPFDRLLLEYKDNRWWIHAEIGLPGQPPRRLGYRGRFDPELNRVVFSPAKRKLKMEA